jgi:hypothetical protein
MTVERRRLFDRDHLSLVYPKTSCPKTVPAKVIAEMFFCELDPVYSVPYILPSMVETDPMTWEPSVLELSFHGSVHTLLI